MLPLNHPMHHHPLQDNTLKSLAMSAAEAYVAIDVAFLAQVRVFF